MVNINNIASLPVKVVFVAHFFFIVWGVQGQWSPTSYFLYNLLLFISLIWAVRDKESAEPLELAIFLEVSGILLDIIILIIYFPHPLGRGEEKFSGSMAVLNLFLRPMAAYVLHKVHGERNGSTGNFSENFSQMFGNNVRQRSPYEDIDNVHHSIPSVHPSTLPTDRIRSPTFTPAGLEKGPPPYQA